MDSSYVKPIIFIIISLIGYFAYFLILIVIINYCTNDKKSEYKSIENNN